MVDRAPDAVEPGIEEEYADALRAVEALQSALSGRPLTNHTPDGRLLLALAWTQQQIAAQRLPIPVDRSYASTIYYLAGSGELDGIAGVKAPLAALYCVLQGVGLVKDRHVPALIVMIDDLLADAKGCDPLSSGEARALAEFATIAGALRDGSWPEARGVAHYPFSGVDTRNLKRCVAGFFGRYSEIENAVFERWRPTALRKPPLPAPVPGLADVAPPLPMHLADDLR